MGNTGTVTDDYKTNISYDKNGNILSFKRNGYDDPDVGAELAMDDFTYSYYELNDFGTGSNYRSNRLSYVTDAVTTSGYDEDLKHGQTSENYKYNRIGELIEDVQEGMKLHWRYGDHKLRLIERTDQDSPEVEFFYNPLGVRVGKLVKPRQNGQLEPQDTWTYYYYAYDANGQLMAVYDSKLYAANGETILEEQYIYGSDRIGVIKQGLTVFEDSAVNVSNNPYVENTLGQKRYELKNYLGTVNVTVSDRKTYNSLEDAFEAVVTNYAETYAFGMLMPNRSFNADGQRHLFHGMEQDPEIKGDGNSYTTEFRQYDPRLGRWKSLDALMYMFPHLSPYVGFDNNPIYFVDPYGLSSEKGDGGGGDSGGDGGDGEPQKTGSGRQNEDGSFDGVDQKVESPVVRKRTFWHKIKGATKTIYRKIEDGVKRAGDQVRSGTKHIGKKIEKGFIILREAVRIYLEKSYPAMKAIDDRIEEKNRTSVKTDGPATDDTKHLDIPFWPDGTTNPQVGTPWGRKDEENKPVESEINRKKKDKPSFIVSPKNDLLERQSLNKKHKRYIIRVITSKDTIFDGPLPPDEKLKNLGNRTVEQISFENYKRNNNISE